MLVEFLPLSRWLAVLVMAAEGVVGRIDLHARHFDIAKPSCIVSRYVGTPFHIEVYGGHSVELAQSIADASKDDAPDLRLVLKLNLRLCWMYVDINIGRIDLEVDEVRHLVAVGNEMAEGFHHCVMETRMSHEAAIDEKELRGTFLACCLGFAHEATYLHKRRLYL